MTSPSELSGTDEAAEARQVEEILGRLIEHGYRFVHPRDDSGEIMTIVGVRAHGAVVDVVRLDAEDAVNATRMPVDEADILAPRTVLWSRDGALAEVVDALLALPEVPDGTSAPRRSGGARGCWVPGTRGRAKWLAATP
ncbi:hypothetical protein [Saccharomonospora iraqiensis]|uniref:hypothetical protein n=1 Tax=Saccharomonospora iraqiensis TaxID=52698 RepID=UPI00022E89B4|nr:hypothetical protein [Saccharomonospora iraqiensis]